VRPWLWVALDIYCIARGPARPRQCASDLRILSPFLRGRAVTRPSPGFVYLGNRGGRPRQVPARTVARGCAKTTATPIPGNAVGRWTVRRQLAGSGPHPPIRQPAGHVGLIGSERENRVKKSGEKHGSVHVSGYLDDKKRTRKEDNASANTPRDPAARQQRQGPSSSSHSLVGEDRMSGKGRSAYGLCHSGRCFLGIHDQEGGEKKNCRNTFSCSTMQQTPLYGVHYRGSITPSCSQ
jgi:hypothetical protein